MTDAESAGPNTHALAAVLSNVRDENARSNFCGVNEISLSLSPVTDAFLECALSRFISGLEERFRVWTSSYPLDMNGTSFIK